MPSRGEVTPHHPVPSVLVRLSLCTLTERVVKQDSALYSPRVETVDDKCSNMRVFMYNAQAGFALAAQQAEQQVEQHLYANTYSDGVVMGIDFLPVADKVILNL